MNKRNAVHENFVKDNLQVVVATVAFGMGIDKPGIYYYIYFELTINNLVFLFYLSVIVTSLLAYVIVHSLFMC